MTALYNYILLITATQLPGYECIDVASNEYTRKIINYYYEKQQN